MSNPNTVPPTPPGKNKADDAEIIYGLYTNVSVDRRLRFMGAGTRGGNQAGLCQRDIDWLRNLPARVKSYVAQSQGFRDLLNGIVMDAALGLKELTSSEKWAIQFLANTGEKPRGRPPRKQSNIYDVEPEPGPEPEDPQAGADA